MLYDCAIIKGSIKIVRGLVIKGESKSSEKNYILSLVDRKERAIKMEVTTAYWTAYLMRLHLANDSTSSKK